MMYERDGKRRVRPRYILAILFAVSLLIFSTYRMITCPDERIQRDVEKLFLEIQQMPGSTSDGSVPSTIYKNCQATISNSYRVMATDLEVRQYFDAELAKHGWVFRKEKKLLDWGKDYEEKEFYYCKGEYSAIIYTTGQREAEVGWTYGFSISWGLDNCN